MSQLRAPQPAAVLGSGCCWVTETCGWWSSAGCPCLQCCVESRALSISVVPQDGALLGPGASGVRNGSWSALPRGLVLELLGLMGRVKSHRGGEGGRGGQDGCSHCVVSCSDIFSVLVVVGNCRRNILLVLLWWVVGWLCVAAAIGFHRKMSLLQQHQGCVPPIQAHGQE